METNNLRISVPAGPLEVELVIKNVPEVLTTEQFEAISDITRTLRTLTNKDVKNKEIISALREKTPKVDYVPRKYKKKHVWRQKNKIEINKEFIANYIRESTGLDIASKIAKWGPVFGNVQTRHDVLNKEGYMQKKSDEKQWGFDLSTLNKW